MLRKSLLFCIALSALFSIWSCSMALPTEEKAPVIETTAKSEVTIVVTQDFGRELVLERKIEIGADTSALDALKVVADVETKYGGGFVGSINGISSEYQNENRGKNDWFFNVNGIACNVGAGDYKLQDGDVEHWDFRSWSYHQFVPAVIGGLPQPFLSGYQGKLKPTIVVYGDSFKVGAETLAEKLREVGVREASAIRDDLLTVKDKASNNLIIIALPGNTFISELNGAHKKLGLYAYFNNGELIILDQEGSPAARYRQDCGLLQATQNPWNPKGIGSGESAVWMITGTDDKGVRSAVEALTNDSAGLRHAFAAIVNENKIMKIP